MSYTESRRNLLCRLAEKATAGGRSLKEGLDLEFQTISLELDDITHLLEWAMSIGNESITTVCRDALAGNQAAQRELRRLAYALAYDVESSDL